MTPPEAFINWVRQNTGVVLNAQTESIVVGQTETDTQYRVNQYFVMPDGGKASINATVPIQQAEGVAYDPGYQPGQTYEINGASGDYYTNGARGYLAAEIVNLGPTQWRLNGHIRWVDNAPQNNWIDFAMALLVMVPALAGVAGVAAAGGLASQGAVVAAESGTAAAGTTAAGWVSAEGGASYAGGLAADAAPVAAAAPEATSIVTDYANSLAEPQLGANEVAQTVVDWGPEISNFNQLAADSALTGPATSQFGNLLQSAGAKLLTSAATAATAAAIAPAAGSSAAARAALLDPLQVQTAGVSGANASPLLIVGLLAWFLLGQ